MKKIISIMLAFFMAISLCITTSAIELPEDISFYLDNEVYQDVYGNEEINNMLSKQGRILDDFFTLMQNFDDSKFGGSYFDEYGQLHILVTEDYIMPASLNQDIYYDIATYSYSQLITFQEIISSHRHDIGFDACGIDDSTNQIVIYCPDPLNTDLLYSLIPQDSVRISKIDPTASDCSTHTVVPGTKIRNDTKAKASSVSCAVVWDQSTSNPKYGFMTCGHGYSVGDKVSYNGASMGTVVKNQYSGSVDASLIQVDNNGNIFNASTMVSDGKEFTRTGGYYPVNTKIYAYGFTSASNNATIIGEITNTKFETTVNGVHFTDLVKTNATAEPGDSGGPVLTANNSYNGYNLTGIIKGRINSDHTMFYVKMSNIKTIFDLNARG